MKIQKTRMLACIASIVQTANLYAQKPTEVPKPSEKPIDLSNPADIIIYIVLPLCAIVLVLIWNKKRRKDKK
ncbi:MAG TPA: hypothetical protein VFM72_08880 [Aequorivita sp.]|nr:hypothetical protein [Aequorivita sp.]